MGSSAELIADRGAAAASADFFRSRPFLDAEGVTHTLRVADAGSGVAIPLIVRAIPGTDLRDATSPYGYPGGKVDSPTARPPDPREADWTPTGLVSVFVRERIGHEPCLAGAVRRSAVQLHDPARPRAVRSRLAEQIRHNARRGYGVEVIPGPASEEAERVGFHSVYLETMRRADAAERYLYDRAYLDAAISFEGSRLIVARSPAGDVAAAAIAVSSDGLLHYYLGGTADRHLADSPFKNVVDAMMGIADELDCALNLGGGVTPGDGLEGFKRGFANSEAPFHTHEIVCDGNAYERLGGDPASGFFPAYRAG